MPDSKEQNYSNHAKFDPTFHAVLIPIFAVNVIVAAVRVFQDFTFGTIWDLIIALALVVLLFKMRIYSLQVQDRVIRLEERLRLSRILPESMHSQIDRLSESQLIALRFASDGELPALVEKTLAGNLANKQIKQAVMKWRPDYFRV